MRFKMSSDLPPPSADLKGPPSALEYIRALEEAEDHEARAAHFEDQRALEEAVEHAYHMAAQLECELKTHRQSMPARFIGCPKKGAATSKQ